MKNLVKLSGNPMSPYVNMTLISGIVHVFTYVFKSIHSFKVWQNSLRVTNQTTFKLF